MLSERSQSQSITYCMVLFPGHYQKDKIRVMENRSVAARSQGWGRMRLRRERKGVSEGDGTTLDTDVVLT